MGKQQQDNTLLHGIAGGTDNDGWSSEYWKYVSEWLNNANTPLSRLVMKKQLNSTAT